MSNQRYSPEFKDEAVRQVILFCARGMLESRAGEALLGKAGKNVTTRNLATTLKLRALAGK